MGYYAAKWIDTPPKRPSIRWNDSRNCWQMKGGFHFPDEAAREWLVRNGFLTRNFELTDKSWHE
jgi:hypothetical protein